MECAYCHSANGADEHRCQRCGRRLSSGEGNPSVRQPYGRGAAAPALQYEAEDREDPAPSTASKLEPPRRSTPFQPSLFHSRVVSFDSFAPEAVEARSKPKLASRPRVKRPVPGQESFAFGDRETVIMQAVPSRRAAEPAIACDAGVAHPLHRLIAAAFDVSIVTIAVALFLLVFFLAGGQLVVNAQTAILCAALAAVLYLLYELMWCMAGADTAGMSWAHLRVVDFNGQTPPREQRLVRFFAAGLGVLAAGLGVLWALVDEESLTWGDHISKTFPTPFAD